MSLWEIIDKFFFKNFEESQVTIFGDYIFPPNEWQTQNCEKWSPMSETILLLKICMLWLFTKILSISVGEALWTLVRLSIVEEYAKNFEHIYKFRNGGGSCWHRSLYNSVYLKWKAFQVFRQINQRIFLDGCVVCKFTYNISFSKMNSDTQSLKILSTGSFNNCILESIVNIHTHTSSWERRRYVF